MTFQVSDVCITYTDNLHESIVSPVWDDYLNHPTFSTWIKGEFPTEKLRNFYMQQLLGYEPILKCLQTAQSLIMDPEELKHLKEIYQEIENQKYLYVEYIFQLYKMTDNDFKKIKMTQVTQSIANHLIESAKNGSLIDLAAAIIPRCMVVYEFDRRRISYQAYGSITEPMHLNKYFHWGEMMRWFCKYIDTRESALDEMKRLRIEDLYKRGFQLEMDYLDMCWDFKSLKCPKSEV